MKRLGSRTPTKHRLAFIVASTFVSLGGCTGQISGNLTPQRKPSGHSTDVGAPPDTAGASCTNPSPGRSPLRRLTRFEYNNTVRDLFGDRTRPADALPPEADLDGFDNDAESLDTSTLLIGKYQEVAHAVATRAVAALDSWFVCNAAQGERSCAVRLISEFGKQAYRRPVETAESERLIALFDRSLVGADYRTALHCTIETMLMAPAFLYRLESDPPESASTRPLSGWELATRLSYTLWGSTPDGTLLAAAEKGELATADQVSRQTDRMLRDPKAHDLVRHFHELWLGLRDVDQLEKDQSVFPSYRPELRPLWREETQRFLEHVVFETDAGTDLLLTAPYTFANHDLAAFYGLPDVSGAEFVQVNTGPGRVGFLTHASLLAINAKANRSEPIFRGTFVRGALLCEPPPNPPPNIPLPPVLAGASTGRERLAAHRAAPSCASCHRLFDPIGLAFENFDGVGLFRETEEGKPIDASGEIVGTDIEGSFVGTVELAHKLEASTQFHSCLVGKWFTFVHGRTPAAADACTLRLLESQFAASGHRIQSLVSQLTGTEAFRVKQVVR